MSQTAFITGASSGIGKATALAFCEHGIDLILCGRNTEALETLKKQVDKKVKTRILSFEVGDKTAVFDAIANLPKDFKKIDILVNNAGNAHGLDSIQNGDPADWDAMIDSNIKGLLYVSNAIIPQMVERKNGMIINVGSLAGKEVYPNGNVYSATKHAVDAINKAMRLDLNANNIRVGAINPGLVETNFSEVRFKGDSQRAKTVYQGFEALRPEDVADAIVFMVSRPAHVSIADMLILPTAQASSTVIDKNV